MRGRWFNPVVAMRMSLATTGTLMQRVSVVSGRETLTRAGCTVGAFEELLAGRQNDYLQGNSLVQNELLAQHERLAQSSLVAA